MRYVHIPLTVLSQEARLMPGVISRVLLSACAQHLRVWLYHCAAIAENSAGSHLVKVMPVGQSACQSHYPMMPYRCDR